MVHLGRGGSGRHVAVKVLRFRPERRLDDRRRFAREVRVPQMLNERCTALILDHNLDVTRRTWSVSTWTGRRCGTGSP